MGGGALGLAPMALDGTHQRGLLAADEGARAQAQLQVEVEAGFEDVLPQQAVFLCLTDGCLQAFDGDGVFRPHVDIALMGAHGVARDGHSLQNGMGIALQYGAVHEGAGVALVGVAADVFDAVGTDRVVGELPLHAGGEARAAPAPEAGGLHRVDDLLGRDALGEDPAQGGIAVRADVLVNILRVDDAAVAQGDTLLVLVEAGLGQRGGGALALAAAVEQALDDAALDDVLGDDLLHVLHAYVGVTSTLGIDGDDGAQRAQAETAGAYHLGLPVHALGGQLFFKFRNDLGALGGGAAGAGAHQDVGTDQTHMTAPPIPPRRWCSPSPRGR